MSGNRSNTKENLNRKGTLTKQNSSAGRGRGRGKT